LRVLSAGARCDVIGSRPPQPRSASAGVVDACDYMRDLIDGIRHDEFAAGMNANATMTRAPDPVNALYDCGCDLVEAASGLRKCAGHPDAVGAAPAVLGCMEAALRELAETSAALSAISDDPFTQGADKHAPARRLLRAERMRTGLRNLEVALQDAASSATAARSLAARVIHGRR